MEWNDEINSKYRESGEMMRHFSTIRAVVISFSLSAFLLIVGLVIGNLQNEVFVRCILMAEFFFFCWSLFFYFYLSTCREVARQCLMRMETGESANPHRSLSSFRFWKDRKFDFFDWMFLSLSIILHLFLYLFVYSL
jgi:hypothetical protein